MSDENKGKATMKNVEGKIQESVGKVTGDPQDKVEGKMKQAQAEAQHTMENVKEKITGEK